MVDTIMKWLDVVFTSIDILLKIGAILAAGVVSYFVLGILEIGNPFRSILAVIGALIGGAFIMLCLRIAAYLS